MLYRFFARLGCHQLPERSFFIKGKQMPLCARCTGVFMGYAAALLLLILGLRPPLWAAALAVLSMAIDWSLQRFWGVMSTNIRRLITGFIGGAGYMLLVIAAAEYIIQLIRNALLG